MASITRRGFLGFVASALLGAAIPLRPLWNGLPKIAKEVGESRLVSLFVRNECYDSGPQFLRIARGDRTIAKYLLSPHYSMKILDIQLPAGEEITVEGKYLNFECREEFSESKRVVITQGYLSDEPPAT